MKTTKTLAILAALVIGGAAFAQEGGGPPPPGGYSGAPSGQGGPGGGQRGMRMGGPMLLHMKEVQKELKLNDDQISKIEALRPQRRRGGEDQGAPPARPSREEMQAKIKAILNSDQFDRFQQIELQAAGPRAFTMPDVQEKLGLSSDQKSKIRDILESERGGLPPANGQNGDFRKTMREHREKLERKLAGVLTEDQQARWKDLVGAKFEFPERSMGGPGMGRGRGQGHGDDQGGPPPPPMGQGGADAPPPPPDRGN